MSRNYSRSAEKRMRELADDASTAFESTVLHNRVHEQVAGQHNRDNHLIRLLDLAERSYDLADEYETDRTVSSEVFAAAERLNDQVDALVNESIARACATIVTESQDWDDVHDPEDLQEARYEARAWLQQHQTAAERAGVWEEVTAHA